MSEVKNKMKANFDVGETSIAIIPYDRGVAKATNEGVSFISTQMKATPFIRDIYEKTVDCLKDIQ